MSAIIIPPDPFFIVYFPREKTLKACNHTPLKASDLKFHESFLRYCPVNPAQKLHSTQDIIPNTLNVQWYVAPRRENKRNHPHSPSPKARTLTKFYFWCDIISNLKCSDIVILTVPSQTTEGNNDSLEETMNYGSPWKLNISEERLYIVVAPCREQQI